MNKFVFTTLNLLIACTFGFVHASNDSINLKPQELCMQNLHVVNIHNVSSQEFKEIMQGHRSDIALEFTSGSVLPLNLFLKGNLVNLIDDIKDIKTIEIKQTFYARCIDKELILSSNLIDWKPCLEFITGNASVILNIQDGQPSVNLGAEVYRRE